MAVGQYYLAMQWRHRFSMWKNLQYQTLGKWISHVDILHMVVTWMAAAISSLTLVPSFTWYIKYLLKYIWHFLQMSP